VGWDGEGTCARGQRPCTTALILSTASDFTLNINIVQ
jgi:hypothetical protein